MLDSIEDLGQSALVALTAMWSEVATFAPNLVGALFIFAVGYVIAKVTANSHLAAGRREREKAEAWSEGTTQDLNDGLDAETAAPDPPSFDALIDGLGLRERTILAFRLVEEHDYPTIAGIMDMSESAVKMAYRRAIERLRVRHPHMR